MQTADTKNNASQTRQYITYNGFSPMSFTLSNYITVTVILFYFFIFLTCRSVTLDNISSTGSNPDCTACLVEKCVQCNIILHYLQDEQQCTRHELYLKLDSDFCSYPLIELAVQRWVVSYLLGPTNIHMGPAPFGTLKSFFLQWMGTESWVDHGGLRHGCHMAPFFILCGVQAFALEVTERRDFDIVA